MRITNQPPDAILDALEAQHPGVRQALINVRPIVPTADHKRKREVYEYQAGVLYLLAAQFNRPGARILEIGTALGYSASVMASAAPQAQIITLNPDPDEVTIARRNLSVFPNVEVVNQKSWDYLGNYGGKPFDMIFIDGDHKRVKADFPWWDKLNPDGLWVFHDYSPAGAKRECPPVFDGVNQWMVDPAQTGGKVWTEPPILVVDDGGTGMAGFYKTEMNPEDRKAADQRAKLVNSVMGYSILTDTHLDALALLAGQIANLQGAIVDVGCGDGGAAALMYASARRKTKPLKRDVWVFDSFAGIPEPDRAKDGDKAYNKWQAHPWCVGSQEKVYDVMSRLKVPDASLYVCAGEFDETLPAFDPGDIALLHIDATLYRSTKAALNHLYAQVVTEGIVTVSAYHHWYGIRNAVTEFFAERGLNPTLITIDGTSVYWKK